MKISEAVGQYLLQLEADGRSHHTIRQARRHTALLVRFLGEREIAEVTHQHVAQFLVSAMAMRTTDGREKKPTSANAVRSAVRTFFGFAHAAGLAPTNAARLVRRAMCGPPVPRALSDGERERLLSALAEAQSVADRRDRVLVHLMLGSGLRLGSAVGLDIEDVDLGTGELRLRRMKGRREDIAFVPGPVLVMLREHLAGRAAGPVFLGAGGERMGVRQVHRRLAEWGLRAGVPGLHPHRLRHTFGTRIYGASRDLLLTARALCHRDVSSAAIYARVADPAVRAAIELG
jgi:site-specific recombinase XerC